MPTRVHITWADDSTLKIETDNGAADAGCFSSIGRRRTAPRRGPCRARRSPNGSTRKSCERGGPRAAIASARVESGAWTPLKVTTTNLLAAWLRPNGVPVGENAVVTEYFDYFTEGEEQWLVVTTMVDDPQYLSERLVISSNFWRERDGAGWAPQPCKG